MKSLTSILLTFLIVVSFSKSDELVIDGSHSEVGFSIKHMMISNVKGKFLEYDAGIDFDVKNRSFKELNATVAARSIDTGITKRDNHLRSADFFEVVKYPKIKYKMTKYTKISDTQGLMEGILTIRGISKKVDLDVTVNGVIKDFDGNTRAGFSIYGEINRKDFGLKWNKALEFGGFAVGDKVKIIIELETMVI